MILLFISYSCSPHSPLSFTHLSAEIQLVSHSGWRLQLQRTHESDIPERTVVAAAHRVLILVPHRDPSSTAAAISSSSSSSTNWSQWSLGENTTATACGRSRTTSRRHPRLVRGVLGETDLLVVRRKLAALQVLRPRVLELAHDVLALPSTLAQTATRRNGLLQHRAHRHVDGAEEQVNVLAAVHLDQWHELHQFHAHFVLFLVAEEIRHCGLVVPLSSANLHGDWLAAPVFPQQTVVRRGSVWVVQVVGVRHAVDEILLVSDETSGVMAQGQDEEYEEGGEHGCHLGVCF